MDEEMKLISELELSIRAETQLRINNINSIEKLLNLTTKELLEWRGLGRKTLNEIRSKLNKNGLCLKDEVVDPNIKKEILENLPGILDGIRQQVEEAIRELRYFSFKLECIAKDAKNHKE